MPKESGKTGVHNLPQYDCYASPVRGTPPDQLGPKMRASIDAVTAQWPKETIVTLFVADAGAGGGARVHLGNGDRADMIATVKEWLARQETLA